MAETVHYHLQQCLPDLHKLMHEALLSEMEIKAINRERTKYEYALARRIQKKLDYLQYIEYETKLMNLVKMREARRAKRNKSKPAYIIFERHIHALYTRLLKKFHGDIDLWLQFLTWLTYHTSANKFLSKAFARAIQLHPCQPRLYILAAKNEMEKRNNVKGARAVLQQGMRLNRQSEVLWLELFRFEVLYQYKLAERKMLTQAYTAPTNSSSLSSSSSSSSASSSSLPESEESRPQPERQRNEMTGQGTSGPAWSDLDLTVPGIVLKEALDTLAKSKMLLPKAMRLLHLMGDRNVIIDWLESLTSATPSLVASSGPLVETPPPPSHRILSEVLQQWKSDDSSDFVDDWDNPASGSEADHLDLNDDLIVAVSMKRSPKDIDEELDSERPDDEDSDVDENSDAQFP